MDLLNIVIGLMILIVLACVVLVGISFFKLIKCWINLITTEKLAGRKLKTFKLFSKAFDSLGSLESFVVGMTLIIVSCYLLVVLCNFIGGPLLYAINLRG